MDRSKIIIRTSIVGIIGNLILVAFKATIGAVTGSIAIILDAVNNLSDALSSIITIGGTKLAEKEPDKDHPYGYGRVEYITSAIIAVIVLMAGFTSAKESVLKVIHPEPASYTVISVVIIAAAVIVKFFMGRYVKSVGEKISSQALIASGSDALFDAILSSGTLVAALVSMLFHISLEGWLGCVISVIIIKAGFEILSETVNSIIGARADRETTQELRKIVRSYPGVNGAYDIILHNYGPTQTIGTVHIEVDDTMPVSELHKITRQIQIDVYDKMDIFLTVGIYASNTTNEVAKDVANHIQEIIHDYPEIMSFHGLYVGEYDATFDLVIDFKTDAHTIRDEVVRRIGELYPQFRFQASIDKYYSD